MTERERRELRHRIDARKRERLSTSREKYARFHSRKIPSMPEPATPHEGTSAVRADWEWLNEQHPPVADRRARKLAGLE